MKLQISMWKLAALGSSLLLMACFVADQAGAFDSHDKTDNPAMLPSSKVKQMFIPTDSLTPENIPVEPKFLPPSKALGNLGVGRSGKPSDTNSQSPGPPGFWPIKKTTGQSTPPITPPTEAKP